MKLLSLSYLCFPEKPTSAIAIMLKMSLHLNWAAESQKSTNFSFFPSKFSRQIYIPNKQGIFRPQQLFHHPFPPPIPQHFAYHDVDWPTTFGQLILIPTP